MIKYTKHILLTICCTLMLTSCGKADVGEMFERYLWQNRVIVILSPGIDNKDRTQQLETLTTNQSGLKERDIVIWDIVHYERISVDGEHKPQLWTPPFYDQFKVDKKDFTFILIGKDGEEKLRKNNTVSAEELFAIIDAMPMRKREMKNIK